MTYITSIGLDVHARSVSACAFDPFTGEVAQRRFGTDAGEIAEWIPGFESPKAVYESGPTGFALCRELRAPGVDCVVGAVSKMQKPSAEKRRKNDRRDAAFLARLLATRNITEAWVPPVEAEAARDLSRALDDAREDLQRARRRLSKFPLRRGPVFDETDALGRRRGAWTRAFCPATEAGCFSRFPTAGAYASWLGLAPSEHSSGEKEAKGGITKTGNSASRRALVEAAWRFKSCSPEPKAPPAGSAVPAAVKRRCDDAAARLRRRHESLGAAGKRPCVANVAVARELACRVREVGRRAEGTLA